MGTGIDLHGREATKAASRAVRDAVSRSCLCGLAEVMGLRSFDDVLIQVTVAVPYPEEVREDEVLEAVPIGRKEILVTKGGMEVQGFRRSGDRTDTVLVANAAITVWVDQDGPGCGIHACGQEGRK